MVAHDDVRFPVELVIDEVCTEPWLRLGRQGIWISRVSVFSSSVSTEELASLGGHYGTVLYCARGW